jgi:hypothetical protein
MTARIPAGLRPVYTASPVRPPVRLTVPEVRDVVVMRGDLPRGYGSQFAGWVS